MRALHTIENVTLSNSQLALANRVKTTRFLTSRQVCTCTLLVLCAGTVTLRAQNVDEKPVATHSNTVLIGDVEYLAEARKDGNLYLRRTQKKVVHEWKLVCKDGGSVAQPPTGNESSVKFHGVKVLSLAHWSSESLLLVVQQIDGDSSSFSVIGLSHVPRFDVNAAEIFEDSYHILVGSPKDSIIAVSGETRSPAVTIVIGRLSEDEPNTIEAGYVAFDWCGDLGSLVVTPIGVAGVR